MPQSIEKLKNDEYKKMVTYIQDECKKIEGIDKSSYLS
jgi:hypothetical protein